MQQGNSTERLKKKNKQIYTMIYCSRSNTDQSPPRCYLRCVRVRCPPLQPRSPSMPMCALPAHPIPYIISCFSQSTLSPPISTTYRLLQLQLFVGIFICVCVLDSRYVNVWTRCYRKIECIVGFFTLWMLSKVLLHLCVNCTIALIRIFLTCCFCLPLPHRRTHRKHPPLPLMLACAYVLLLPTIIFIPTTITIHTAPVTPAKSEKFHPNW